MKWDAVLLFGKAKGWSKTWVVSAKQAPVVTKLQHDLGLAVITKAMAKKTDVSSMQVWRPQRRGKGESTSTPAPVQRGSPQSAWGGTRRGQQAPAKAGLQHQAPCASAGATPDLLLEQMQAMIQSALAPLQAQNASLTREITAMKNAMDGNGKTQEDEPADLSELDGDENMKDSNKRAAVPEPTGTPPSKKGVASHRSGPY